MKSIIPALKHFWADLSAMGKALFIVSNIVIFLVFLLLLIWVLMDIQNKNHYRQIIEGNDTRLDNICRNEPRLCENE